MIRETFDYPDYLSAKKPVDDESLNQAVWKSMINWLKTRQDNTKSLKILEIGAGIGTMLERLLETDLLTNCTYTAIEMEAPFRESAFNRLENWSKDNNFSFTKINKDKILISNNDKSIELDWIIGDVLNIKDRIENNYYDLLIGHAVIDLLPVPQCMPGLLTFLKPGAGFYLSLNFSGNTQFIPAHPEDEKISAAYHQDMDNRFPDLDWQPSLTGIALGPWLTSQGHKIIEHGPSDWKLPLPTLTAETNGLFIANILDTIENA